MRKITAILALLLAAWAGPAVPAVGAEITITILHTNDMHAHLEPFTQRGREMGGYARQATLINRYRATDPNPLVLCAGDTFQGTLYFNVYEGLADLAYMNYVGVQAMAVGNHEFDRGPAILARFAGLARFPLLAANLDVGTDQGLAPLIKPSAILEAGGERIGVVGAVPVDLMSISSPGPTIRMTDLVPSVQAAVDALTAAGVDKVILLSHVGYKTDLELAGTLTGVDVIVGGHSHTLLGAVPGLPQPAGEYPTVLRGPDGGTVLVVQAWEWGKVLGRIKVRFDTQGRVAGWDDAAPVPVDASVEEDPTVRTMAAAFARPLAVLRDQVVAHAPKGIATTRVTLRHAENPMANVIADAMLAATAKGGSVAAFVNAGGVRAGIEPGPITYGQAVAVQPFNNTLVQLDLTGGELKAILEEALGNWPESGAGLLCPSRGTSYAIDLDRPAGSRTVDLVVAGEPVREGASYRVTLPSFVAGGGDNHPLAKLARGTRYDTGILDIDAFVEFLKAHDPIAGDLEGRVTLTGQAVAPLAVDPAAPPAAVLEPAGQSSPPIEAGTARSVPAAAMAATLPDPPAPAEVPPLRIERTRFPSGKDRVAADVFTPPGTGPYPVVALLHGAHPRRSEKYYMELGEDLARRGFLTMFVRVYERGRKGRGTRADWRRSVSDALTFAASLPAADPTRMGVLGFSLGAFLALEQAPVDPRIQAAVAFYGGIGRGLTDLPLDTMPPVLLLHGTADRIVPARRSVEAAEQLRQAGREADLIVYPTARHGFCLNSRGGVDRHVATDAWSRAVAFLDRRLLGPAETLPETAAAASCEDWLDVPEGELEVLVNPSPDEVKQATPPPPKRKLARPAVKPSPTTAPTAGATQPPTGH
jgi:5'-nucleotidase